MGTRADFYVGIGPEAEWVGSIAYDGYPDGVIADYKTDVSEFDYIRRFSFMLPRALLSRNPSC